MTLDTNSAIYSHYSIVLVDDEIPILKTLERALRQFGFNITCFSVPSEALDYIGNHDVHLVISDFRMPLMNGNNLLKNVRDISPDTVGLILSGYTDADMLVEMINLGVAFKFLHKPWKNEALYDVIDVALNEYEKRHNESTVTQLYTSEHSVVIEIDDSLAITKSNLHLSDSKLIFDVLLSVDRGNELIHSLLEHPHDPLTLVAPVFGLVTLKRQARIKNKHVIEIEGFSSVVIQDNQSFFNALSELTIFLRKWEEFYVFTTDLLDRAQLQRLKSELRNLYKNVVCIRDPHKKEVCVWVPTDKFHDPNRIKVEIEIILESITYAAVEGTFEPHVDFDCVKKETFSVF
ncbi:response regulator [Pseudoalteromonas xiamenensis]